MGIVVALGAVEGFDKECCEKLGNQTRLRNIVTHAYLDVRWPALSRFIREMEPDYTKFIGHVKEYLNRA